MISRTQIQAEMPHNATTANAAQSSADQKKSGSINVSGFAGAGPVGAAPPPGKITSAPQFGHFPECPAQSSPPRPVLPHQIHFVRSMPQPPKNHPNKSPTKIPRAKWPAAASHWKTNANNPDIRR